MIECPKVQVWQSSEENYSRAREEGCFSFVDVVDGDDDDDDDDGGGDGGWWW
jgi:hypothetical protein